MVILGAGGAARAAALALRRKGARVTLLARDPDKAAAVGGGRWAARTARSPTWRATPGTSSSTPRRWARARPAGDAAARASCTARARSSSTWSTTRWRRASCARRRPPGCTIIDGLEMLLAQAVAQFETWTGLEAPVDAMKSAALFLAQEQES